MMSNTSSGSDGTYENHEHPSDHSAGASPDEGRSAEERSQVLPPVYACSYDHIGIVLWGRDRLRQSVEKALDRLARYPSFTVGWDHEAYTYDWLAEHDAGLLETMRDAVAESDGRIGVGGSTYGQPLSAFIDGESNIRQLAYAVRAIRRHLDYRLTIYLTSEHAFHPQIPQLLVGCGFEGAVLRTHFMMYGHNAEIDEPIIWWTGVDGSRLPTIPTYQDQGSTPPRSADKIPGPTSTFDNRIMTDSISRSSPSTLEDFREAFGARIMPLIATRADDDRSLESLIEAHEGDEDIRFTTLEGAFAVAGSPRAEHRFTVDELRSRMPWGYCGNWIFRDCRRAEKRLLTAERLLALVEGDDAAWSAALDEAWKALLLAQHHDIQICGREKEAREALDRCREHTDRALASVGVAPLDSEEPRGDGRRPRFAFNPLPWSRREIAGDCRPRVLGSPNTEERRSIDVPALGLVPLDGASAGGADKTAFKFEGDTTHPWLSDEQVVGDESRHVPEPVARLETPFYEVCFGASGGIRLLVDRASKRRLLGPPFASGALAAVMNGSIEYSTGRIGDPQIGSDSVTITEEGSIGGLPYTSSWTFYTHRRRVDWHGTVEFDPDISIGRVRSDTRPPVHEGVTKRNSELHTAFADHEYKLRLRFFPFVSPFAKLYRDTPFAYDQTESRYPQGLHWTAYADGAAGLALLNRGLMGTILESDGALSSVLGFSLPYTWGTRLLDGRYRFELGVLPFVGEFDARAVGREAAEYNHPVLPLESEFELPARARSFIDRSSENVILSALYRRDGKLYARFAETEGRNGVVGVSRQGRPARLAIVDLLENEGAEVGSMFRMRPWQVQTFLILPATPRQ